MGLLELWSPPTWALQLGMTRMLWIAKLIENKYVVYALAVAGVLLSLWGYGKWQYHSGYSTAEKDRYLADLESFRLESLRLHDLSTTL